MPSWEEWTRYLDEQEQELEEPSQESPAQYPAAPEPAFSAVKLEEQRPAPASHEEEFASSPPTFRPEPAAVQVGETRERAIVQRAVRTRRRAPAEMPGDAADREIAQNSYKNFKETREQLLERLLDPQLSLEDTARILNVCPTTVRRYTNKGALKHIRTAGNQRRFRLSDVLDFMEYHSGETGILDLQYEGE